jgi:cellulose synthase/poly-beta-1,6-N-acetylglucosamine synthase-like glycosyltransferase
MMILEKRWIATFFALAALWAFVLLSTLYTTVEGIETLVDDSLDLSLVTIPLMAFSLVYATVTVFIFILYLVTYKKAEHHQLRLKAQYSSNNRLMDNDQELCSIIIPARNEEDTIKRTVERCLQQTYRNLEVVVICHNCTDRTFEEAHVKDSRVKVYDVKTKEVGKGIALNQGVEKATGNFLLILDGDGMLSRDFIESTMPMFKEGYAAVQGRYVPSNRNYNFVTRMLSLEGDLWSTPYMTIRTVLGKKVSLGGTGYIVRKDILVKVGMFENHLVDDYELTFRLLRNKYKIAFAPLSICYDEKPPTLQFMMRQRARWFKGFMSLMRHRIAEPGDLIGNLYWINPIAILSGIVGLLIAGFAGVHNLLFGYYPYKFAYLSIELWFLLYGSMTLLQAMVLTRQYGRAGLRYALLLPIFIGFSNYWLAAAMKSFFVKSWGNTKTTHGFISKSDMEKLVAGEAEEKKG